MEAECKDYLDPLNYDLQGQMAIVLSNWENSEGENRADFESNNAPKPSGCTDAKWSLYGLEVYSFTQNEEREDGDGDGDGDGEPEPAEWLPFIGYVEEWEGSGDGEWYEFYVKGLDGQKLETDDTCLMIG